jgi:hypothetical protein
MSKENRSEHGVRRGTWAIAAYGFWVLFLLGGLGLNATNVKSLGGGLPKRIMPCRVIRQHGYTLEWPLLKIDSVDVLGPPEVGRARVPVGWFHLGARGVTRSLSGVRLLRPGSAVRVVWLWGRWRWLAEARAWLLILGAAVCFVSLVLALVLGRAVRDKSAGRMVEIEDLPANRLGMARVQLRFGLVGHIALAGLALGTLGAAAIAVYTISAGNLEPALLPLPMLTGAGGSTLALLAMIIFQWGRGASEMPQEARTAREQ